MSKMQANCTGNVLRSEIVGSIRMRVYLSGMPELRLGLNDKVLFESTGRGKSKSVELEDVKFHQCVRLSRCVYRAGLFGAVRKVYHAIEGGVEHRRERGGQSRT